MTDGGILPQHPLVWEDLLGFVELRGQHGSDFCILLVLGQAGSGRWELGAVVQKGNDGTVIKKARI